MSTVASVAKKKLVADTIAKVLRKHPAGKSGFVQISFPWAMALKRAVGRVKSIADGDSFNLLNGTYHREPGLWTLQNHEGKFHLAFVFDSGPFTSRSQSRSPKSRKKVASKATARKKTKPSPSKKAKPKTRAKKKAKSKVKVKAVKKRGCSSSSCRKTARYYRRWADGRAIAHACDTHRSILTRLSSPVGSIKAYAKSA